MPDYSILLKAKINTASLQAELKRISQSSATINVKAKVTDGEKLQTVLGKIDNQLARIKITNKDAFANSQNVRYSYNETVRFRNALERRVRSAEHTCIEQVPELKHNKEREEHSQPIGSHPPLFTVKPEEHSHK